MDTAADHPLRRYREANDNLSLEGFARKVGVTAATISRIENRKQGVTLALALKIADETRNAVRPSDLLGEAQ